MGRSPLCGRDRADRPLAESPSDLVGRDFGSAPALGSRHLIELFRLIDRRREKSKLNRVWSRRREVRDANPYQANTPFDID